MLIKPFSARLPHLLLLALACALATPARAIDAVTAVDMCGKNPSCKASINPADGWIDIFVGDDQVMCNPRGDQQCTCITCAKAPKGKAATPAVGVPGVISGSSARTKTPVVGIPRPDQSNGKRPAPGFPKPVKETKTRPPVMGFPRGAAKASGNTTQPAPKQSGWKEPARATTGHAGRRK